MLSNLKDILAHARENHYAVPAFDCIEDVMVRGVIETCERLRSPAIIMGLGSPDLEGKGWEYLASLVLGVAPHYDIPVALHLDHATKMDEVKRAIDVGFTSIMYDGSAHPFEKNVELTRQAVEIARPHGIPVEAELGAVGGANVEETTYSETTLTQPHEVERFLAETEVDALAISIGTSHGVYRSLPNLDIELLKKLNAVSNVPLVLHGGSGTPSDQIAAAALEGITKLNIYADNRIAMFKGLRAAAADDTRPDPLPRDMFAPIRQGVADTVEHNIRLLYANDRY